MQPILDGGYDAEISAATAQAPEQVHVFFVARSQEVSVGGDDFEGRHVVAGEPEAPAEPSEAATQREARGARVGIRAGRGRKPECRAFMIELTEQRAGFQVGAPRFGVDANALHLLQVDHEPAVTGGLA